MLNFTLTHIPSLFVHYPSHICTIIHCNTQIRQLHSTQRTANYNTSLLLNVNGQKIPEHVHQLHSFALHKNRKPTHTSNQCSLQLSEILMELQMIFRFFMLCYYGANVLPITATSCRQTSGHFGKKFTAWTINCIFAREIHKPTSCILSLLILP